MKSDEDYEFERIERENRPKSSGMDCCTYDCIQGRDCPVRKAKWADRQGNVWPFPNKPPEHEPLGRLPFNPDNYEDAPF